MQHTDCGITRLVNDPAMLGPYFEVSGAELATKAVADPRAAVAVDVDALHGISALPDEWLLSGLVYDVANGHVEMVLPPARVRTRTLAA
jgi:carbonic anhydrase